MSRYLCLALVAGVMLLAACTVDETIQPTLPPPITLAVPPEVTLLGNCEQTSALEQWLQTTSLALSDFITTMNSAAGQERAEMYDEILFLAALRDAAAAAKAPDCALDTQIRMVDGMNTAVTTFQGYFNGDLTDLGTMIGDVSGQLDRVIAAQNELIIRLESQFSQQQGGG